VAAGDRQPPDRPARGEPAPDGSRAEGRRDPRPTWSEVVERYGDKIYTTAYRLTGFERMRVAVSYTGDGLLGGHTLSPTGPAAERITVYP